MLNRDQILKAVLVESRTSLKNSKNKKGLENIAKRLNPVNIETPATD